MATLVPTCGSAQAGRAPGGYQEADRVTIRHGKDSAFIVLWLDERLDLDATDAVPARDDFRPGLVALLDLAGDRRSSLTLTRPVGRLSQRGSPFEDNEVLVAEQQSDGAGSYRGWVTRIARVYLPGPVRWEAVREPGTSWWTELQLSETGKDAWRVVGREIRTVSIRPVAVSDSRAGQDTIAFESTLSRLRRIQGGWARVVGTAPGLWEYDMEFPPDRDFPSWPARTDAE